MPGAGGDGALARVVASRSGSGSGASASASPPRALPPPAPEEDEDSDSVAARWEGTPHAAHASVLASVVNRSALALTSESHAFALASTSLTRASQEGFSEEMDGDDDGHSGQSHARFISGGNAAVSLSSTPRSDVAPSPAPPRTSRLLSSASRRSDADARAATRVAALDDDATIPSPAANDPPTTRRATRTHASASAIVAACRARPPLHRDDRAHPFALSRRARGCGPTCGGGFPSGTPWTNRLGSDAIVRARRTER